MRALYMPDVRNKHCRLDANLHELAIHVLRGLRVLATFQPSRAGACHDLEAEQSEVVSPLCSGFQSCFSWMSLCWLSKQTLPIGVMYLTTNYGVEKHYFDVCCGAVPHCPQVAQSS